MERACLFAMEFECMEIHCQMGLFVCVELNTFVDEINFIDLHTHMYMSYA